MLSSGLYKLSAGYARNYGMELGMANPEWGYWWRVYQKLSPEHWLFKILNHLAWSTEVAIATLLFIPQTRFWGGLLLIVSFAFIATQIRLGALCEVVMIGGLFTIPPDSALDAFLQRVVPSALIGTNPALSVPSVIPTAVAGVLIAYMCL